MQQQLQLQLQLQLQPQLQIQLQLQLLLQIQIQIHSAWPPQLLNTVAQTLCRCHYSIISSWLRHALPQRPSVFYLHLNCLLPLITAALKCNRAACGMPHTWLALLLISATGLLKYAMIRRCLCRGSFRSSNAKVIKYTFKIFTLRQSAYVCVCVPVCLCVCVPATTWAVGARPRQR